MADPSSPACPDPASDTDASGDALALPPEPPSAAGVETLELLLEPPVAELPLPPVLEDPVPVELPVPVALVWAAPVDC